jgi:hypothetical protein
MKDHKKVILQDQDKEKKYHIFKIIKNNKFQNKNKKK